MARGDIKINPAIITPPEAKQPKETDTCECDGDDNEHTKIIDADAEQFIAFENELHNIIYVK